MVVKCLFSQNGGLSQSGQKQICDMKIDWKIPFHVSWNAIDTFDYN